MITHDICEYVDGRGLFRGRCGAVVNPDDVYRPDRIVDCMTCLVREARRSANRNGDIIGSVISINRDGTVVIDLETAGLRP